MSVTEEDLSPNIMIFRHLGMQADSFFGAKICIVICESRRASQTQVDVSKVIPALLAFFPQNSGFFCRNFSLLPFFSDREVCSRAENGYFVPILGRKNIRSSPA